MQKSEDNRKHDLGLKTTVRTLQEIKKPKSGMIVGMITLLLLICGFNALVLLNMGIFSNANQNILMLDEYLQHAFVSIYVTTYIRLSSMILIRYSFFERLYRLPHSKQQFEGV